MTYIESRVQGRLKDRDERLFIFIEVSFGNCADVKYVFLHKVSGSVLEDRLLSMQGSMKDDWRER